MSSTSAAEIQAAAEGRTVPSAFLDTVAAESSRVALRWQDGAGWRSWTFADYADRVARAAAGLQALGLRPGDRVVLMMRNIPEFHVLDLAANFCGATAVSIYNSSSPDQVQYLAGHSKARIGVVEDMGYLERFLKVRGDLPDLEQLGILQDPDGLAPEDVFRAGALFDADPIDLAEAATRCRPEDLATIIYTSGTTGPPKGVMISHANIAWTVESLRRRFDLDQLAGQKLVSYLPMAHIAERMTSHYQQAFVGFDVTTCPDPGQIGPYLREVRPNIVFGVPRVWEKIHAGVTAAMGADPDKAAQFAAAVEAAVPIAEARDWGHATPAQLATWDALDELGFASVRSLIGLDECVVAITGAAPIPPEVLRWYRAIGVPLSEIYGMSENTGPMTWTPNRVKIGTVGPAIPGCEVRLADDGEVLCRGGNVFGGYLDAPDKTAEALADGWLHTGDIGQLDEDGYLRIVDRKKELIITAGGKNVSPANLEAALKTIPLVGQAMAVGDDRPFVAALVVLDPEVAPVWARAHGIEADSLADLARTPEVVAEVESSLADAMAGFNNAERVKKVTVLGEEWLPDSDVLTPTSKLKRRGVLARYHDEIDALYA
ncbi:MAG TPA: long-chain fatty acid--CoA ligase [Acidimicrobiales bacterium]|nr:long-chain fatty acid--CoA ligase [Acidimicrobiales bacterium]